ncbi:hypothetical protein PtB15_1B785 [Puccinia triticina]|nr:hypothetical protein PtB15_1B785 [Puccinia triticina]
MFDCIFSFSSSPSPPPRQRQQETQLIRIRLTGPGVPEAYSTVFGDELDVALGEDEGLAGDQAGTAAPEEAVEFHHGLVGAAERPALNGAFSLCKAHAHS